MTWEIKIEKVKNGYIVRHESDMNEDLEVKYVFEEEEGFLDQDLKDREKFIDLCWYLQEYFGLSNSKHNKYNMSYKVEENKDE